MAEFDMVSSHAPWEPVPALVDWATHRRRLGTTTARPAPATRRTSVYEREIDRVRDDFARSIAYSLRTLVSYVETYGDDNLVLVMLGDHQPAPIISGTGAGREVPVTIVARDPAVLDRISGLGLAGRPAPGSDGAGLADGRVPRPVPRDVRASAVTRVHVARATQRPVAVEQPDQLVRLEPASWLTIRMVSTGE